MTTGGAAVRRGQKGVPGAQKDRMPLWKSQAYLPANHADGLGQKGLVNDENKNLDKKSGWRMRSSHRSAGSGNVSICGDYEPVAVTGCKVVALGDDCLAETGDGKSAVSIVADYLGGTAVNYAESVQLPATW